MSSFESVRDSLRRAYRSSRDSVQRARAQARFEPEDREGPAEPRAQLKTVAVAVGPDQDQAVPPAEQAPVGPGRASARSRTVTVLGRGPNSGRPIVVSTSVTHRDDLDVPRGLRVAAAWAWRLLLLVLLAWLLFWLIGRLQVVVVPLTIATLLSALLSPLVNVLTRRRMHRSLASALVLVGGLAAVVGTMTLVVSQFVAGAPKLADKTTAGIEQIQQSLKRGPLHFSDDQLNHIGDSVKGYFTQHQDNLTSGALATAGTLTEVLTGVFLVLFSTFFFLRDGSKIAQFVFGILPRPVRAPIISAADAAWATLVAYVRATVLVAFIDAVGIGLAMVILQIPFPFALAALVFLAAFVPIVGATVSGAIAVLVAFVDQGLVTALILLGAVIAVQQLEGHVLQPLIMGKAVAVHPLAVILAIAAGVVLGGIPGALVAVPIVAVLNTGIRHLYQLREGKGDQPTPPTGPPMP